MLRRYSPSARRLTTVLAMCLGSVLAGCATSSDPRDSGGQGLPGTEDASCRGNPSLLFSPDGRWLIYESLDGDPFAPVFAFVDVQSLRRRTAALTAAAANLAKEGRGPELRGCWNASSTVVYLRGSAAWFAANVTGDTLELAPVKQPECARTPPDPFEPEDQVRRASPTRVRIETSDGRVLAEHTPQDVAADRIDAQFLSRAPGGQFLSYIVTEYRGSFTAPPRGYVLQIAPAGTPRLLGAPVFGAPGWSADGNLYACTGRSDRSQPRIVRWNVRTW